jgi:hypothetical protein
MSLKPLRALWRRCRGSLEYRSGICGRSLAGPADSDAQWDHRNTGDRAADGAWRWIETHRRPHHAPDEHVGGGVYAPAADKFETLLGAPAISHQCPVAPNARITVFGKSL